MKTIHTQIALALLLTCSYSKAQLNYNLCAKASFGSSNAKTHIGKQKSNFSTGLGAEAYIKVKAQKISAIYINPSIEYNNVTYTGQLLNAIKDVRVKYINIAIPAIIVSNNKVFSYSGPSIHVGIGPYIAIATSGKYNTIQNDSYKAFKFGNATTDNRTLTDAGIRLKLGISTNKVVLSMANDIGVANNYPAKSITNGQYTKLKNFMFQISYRLR